MYTFYGKFIANDSIGKFTCRDNGLSTCTIQWGDPMFIKYLEKHPVNSACEVRFDTEKSETKEEGRLTNITAVVLKYYFDESDRFVIEGKLKYVDNSAFKLVFKTSTTETNELACINKIVYISLL